MSTTAGGNVIVYDDDPLSCPVCNYLHNFENAEHLVDHLIQHALAGTKPSAISVSTEPLDLFGALSLSIIDTLVLVHELCTTQRSAFFLKPSHEHPITLGRTALTRLVRIRCKYVEVDKTAGALILPSASQPYGTLSPKPQHQSLSDLRRSAPPSITQSTTVPAPLAPSSIAPTCSCLLNGTPDASRTSTDVRQEGSALSKEAPATAAAEETAAAEPIPRSIISQVHAHTIQESASAWVRHHIGVKGCLHRMDPFLLFDEFYITPPGGFPPHPHHGVDTVKYMIDGLLSYKDNQGNSDTLGPGDLLWTMAGRGIVHSEMTKRSSGLTHALQLWIDLPAADKNLAPRVQHVASKDIPEYNGEGIRVRVLAGTSKGVSSPVRTLTPTLYLDITMRQDVEFVQEIPPSFNGFVYILSGKGEFGRTHTPSKQHHCLELSTGNSLYVKATSLQSPLRFVLVAGKPVNEPAVTAREATRLPVSEPIVKSGPVLNEKKLQQQQQKDLEKAFEAYHPSGLQ